MGWVDLSTLYVPKSGGTMTGSLTVPANKTLTCYNGTTAYNVGATLKSLQDSVSELNTSVSKIVAGSTIKALSKIDSTHSVATFTAEELKKIIGTDWQTGMVMVCSNGDAAAQNNIYSIVCAWNGSSKQMNVMCNVSSASSGNMRLNYICYLTA